jgi:hypothetical protein
MLVAIEAPLMPMAGTASQVTPPSVKPDQPKMSQMSRTTLTRLPSRPHHMGTRTSRRPAKNPVTANDTCVATALTLRHWM